MTCFRAQENQFKDFICSAVLPHVHRFEGRRAGVVQSTTDEDTRLSFDLRVGMWVPVSVRIRKNYALQFRDVSIRSRTEYSGQVINGELVKCEIDKLLEGNGCCYFYGWLTPDMREIADYIIVDVDALRPYLDDWRCFNEKPNPDGRTWARYYSLDLLRAVGALVYDHKEAAAA